MKKAIVVTLVLGLLLSAGVFGAAQKEEGAEQKDIVIWLDSSWSARHQDGWRVDVAKAYMKQHPNVNIAHCLTVFLAEKGTMPHRKI